MASIRKAVAPFGLLVAALLLAGCPLRPVLSVTPLAVNVAAEQDASQFQISNIGVGTLTWTASESAPWLSLALEGSAAAPASSLSGSTASGVSGVRAVVNRSGLEVGSYSTEVIITSNGGSATVRVSVVVGGAASLRVSEDNLTFGSSLERIDLALSNAGTEQLQWKADISEDAPWLSVAPAAGTLPAAPASTTIAVNADRAGLASGSYSGTITFTFAGGTISVTASMIVPEFEVTPASIDFGTVFTTKSSPVAIRNRGFNPIDVSISPATIGTGNWLDVNPGVITLGDRQSQSVEATVDASGLAPGVYQGQLQVSVSGSSLTVSIPVTMTVSSFQIQESVLDFGTIDTPSTLPLHLSSVGASAVAWQSVVPVDAPWLSVNPPQGNLLGNDIIQVSVDPTRSDPGNYQAVLGFTHAAGTTNVTVRFTLEEPASLTVAPSSIDLGANKTSELIGIWNPGRGSVNWSLSTAGFPAWLSLSPAPGGVASGTVSGDLTDSVTITVNRDLAPANVFDLEYAFNVQASGDFTGTVPVTIRARVPQIPVLLLVADLGDDGVNFLDLDTEENTDSFLIRNNGNGPLEWAIDLTGKPVWITSVQPSSGIVLPGREQSVSISVDRTTLSYLGAQHEFTLTSNDPLRGAVPLRIEVLVPKRVAIGTRPNAFAFGPTQNSDVLEVANTGDPDTIMNFRLEGSKSWISVFPPTGTSIGTASSIKDFRPFSVTVDRSLIEGNGDSGLILVTAIDEDNQPLEDVAPFEVPISVQAAQLTIETTARPYLRVPSVVRFPLMLRNVRYQIIPLSQGILPEIAKQFTILENDVELELTESAQRLKAYTLDGGRDGGIRQTALILLDYSGSMQAAAGSVTDPAIANAPDPIQALYERCIPELLDTLPANMDVGLAIFSDRSNTTGTPLRPLFGSASEPVEQQDDVFISDREALKDRLASVVVNDNGATQLFGAIIAGVEQILYHDFDRNLYFSDFTDFPALICFTDGRITTPPSPINDVITLLQDTRIRYYPVGWGRNVSANPLVRLATASGGHFYSTRTEPTTQIDEFGNPVRRPIVAELENWCVATADECDQSIGRDFDSVVALSFVSLNEESNTAFQTRLSFNDPNDQNSSCVVEQGTISASATSLAANMASIATDNNIAQISFRSDGISGGEAIVTARMEYAPRNLTQFHIGFDVVGGNPLTIDDVALVPVTRGGIISNWEVTEDIDGYIFSAPAGNPVEIGYGNYGDLFTLAISGVGAEFTLEPVVISPVFTSDPESKAICLPDGLTVGTGPAEYFAPALPTPLITTSIPYTLGVPHRITLPAGVNEVDFTIQNIGGSLPEGSLGLNWTMTITGDTGSVSTAPPDLPQEGLLFSTASSYTIPYFFDRTGDPGTYTARFTLTYDYNVIGLEIPLPEIVVVWTIGAPGLNVPTTTLDFGALTSSLPLTVENSGQGTLLWQIDNTPNDGQLPPLPADNSFPSWLTATSTAGAVLFSDPSASYAINIDRTGLAPGNYTFTFLVVNAADLSQSQRVAVNMIVP